MRRAIYDYFFLAVLVLVLYGVLKLLSPFLGSILVALICAVTFDPMHRALQRRLPKLHASLRAAVSVSLVFIFFVTPVLILGWALTHESETLIGALKEGRETVAQLQEAGSLDSVPWVGHARFFLAKAFGVRRAQFQEIVIQGVHRTLEYVSLTGALLAQHAVIFIFDLLIMLFVLFFMFRDGERLFREFQAIIPIRQQNKQTLIARIQDTFVGIVRGLFLSVFLQGVIATIGYLIVGAEGAIVLGTLTAMSGVLPMVGTLGVWVPVGLYFLLQGSYAKGVFVLVWGAVFVVGLMDLIVRPYLVGKRAQLPLLALFFALLGGMKVWGAKGIVIGPLLVALAPILLDMYKARYARFYAQLEEDSDLEPSAEIPEEKGPSRSRSNPTEILT